MTVAVNIFAGLGAITVLAALILYRAAWREAGICRHVDAQTTARPARVYDWECEPESGCPDCTSPLNQADVDLEYRKLWATTWPGDYRRNYRKELA